MACENLDSGTLKGTEEGTMHGEKVLNILFCIVWNIKWSSHFIVLGCNEVADQKDNL
jgi:hypothetical protein